MTSRLPRLRLSRREDGFMMIAVIFIVAIISLSLIVAIPYARDEIRRDREVETIHRGRQYVRAIQLYYRRFHAYPPTLDALSDTNGIRFLRKSYADPFTPGNEWRPIMLGQNKSPTVMGLFGQPLSMGLSGLPLPGAPAGAGDGQSLSAGDAGGANNSSPGGANVSNPSGAATGQILGGGGVIGVSPSSPDRSILIYKLKNHYNEWEFVYDPAADRVQQVFMPVQQQGPPTNTGSPGFNTGGK